MKQYPDFEFSFEKTNIDDVLQSLPAGWGRDRASEAELGAQFRVLDCSSSKILSPATFFLFIDSDNSGHVTNILPSRGSGETSMTPEEYAICLQALSAEVLKSDAFIKQGRSEVSFKDLLAEQSYAKLRAFLNTANKSTGSAHPRDRELWVSFIRAAVEEKAPLTADQLSTLLWEAGWREDIAARLAHEYEFGLDVINRVSA
ncbi:MAG: hypothetical protein ABI383_14650 [Acidobacteriaceae bacterium]